MEGKVSWRCVQVIFYTEGIQDVTREERNPAYKETNWKKYLRISDLIDVRIMENFTENLT